MLIKQAMPQNTALKTSVTDSTHTPNIFQCFYFWKCLKIQYKIKRSHAFKETFVDLSGAPTQHDKKNNIGQRIRINTRQNMKRNSHLHKIFFFKKRLPLSTCRHVFMLATIAMTLFVLSPGGGGSVGRGGLGIRNSSRSQRESKRTQRLRRQETHLSGRVGAGTGAVTPAAGRSGAWAAACWGSSPRGAGPTRIQVLEVKRQKIMRFDLKTVKPSVTELLTENHSAHLLLMRGGLRRHIGGGGGIRRGGDSLRGGGRTRWVSTADAVISCPSIWPTNTHHRKLF